MQSTYGSDHHQQQQHQHQHLRGRVGSEDSMILAAQHGPSPATAASQLNHEFRQSQQLAAGQQAQQHHMLSFDDPSSQQVLRPPQLTQHGGLTMLYPPMNIHLRPVRELKRRRGESLGCV
jgi:hypothetical protein